MKEISGFCMRHVLATVVSCEGARHTVPSPQSPSQTGVNALLVGEGQGEGWLRSREREASPVERASNNGSLHLLDFTYQTDAVRFVVPLSLSLPHKGGGNAVALPCPNTGPPSRGRQVERPRQNGGTAP
jgi:hypothetical protein